LANILFEGSRSDAAIRPFGRMALRCRRVNRSSSDNLEADHLAVEAP